MLTLCCLYVLCDYNSLALHFELIVFVEQLDFPLTIGFVCYYCENKEFSITNSNVKFKTITCWIWCFVYQIT